MDEGVIRSLLSEAVVEYGLTGEQLDKLVRYLALLVKWNKTYNLTAIRDPKEMVRLHLIDSLSVLSYVKARGASGPILDVGSGAGLPSIPLAICLPDRQVFAVDKVQKKTSFMMQARAELELKNFNAIHGRVEKLNSVDFGVNGMSIIISRAFSEMALFVSLTKHLLEKKGCWLAMKGVKPVSELEVLDKVGEYVTKVIPLDIAHLEAERHLVEIRFDG